MIERGRKNNQSKLGQSKQSPGVDKERPPNRFQLLSQRKPIITKQKRSNEQVSLRFTSKETFFLDVQQRHHHRRHQLLLLLLQHKLEITSQAVRFQSENRAITFLEFDSCLKKWTPQTTRRLNKTINTWRLGGTRRSEIIAP